MGVSCEPPLNVFVYDTCEVFDSHVCGSVLHGGRPRPASLRGFVRLRRKKFGRRPMACLFALLSMPSMVVSCLSLNTPR